MSAVWPALACLVACGARIVVPSAPRDVGCSVGDSPAYDALCARLAEDPDNIAELLPLLDDDLLGNFTLVYETRGPQRDVDRQHPRIILFGRDARLLLAFTGETSHRSLR